MTSFPEHGRSRDAILGAITDARARDLTADGRAFAFVYDAGDETRALAREAFAACMPVNGLDPTVYPSARKLENAVVAACLELARAPDGAVGTATAGGTESVMLAVKAARDFAKKARPELTRPKMLLPETAHACFHKAASYLGVEVVSVKVDPVTFRADVDDARAKMTSDVVLVVGSAPSYAHGVVDPIVELAALAKAHDARMHVDACVGGLVLPFLRELGRDVPPFDFTVDGVTSMSMDLHKYGFAPKGASVVLMRDRALRDAQYFACATWTGYSIVNSTTLGSKSVAALGAAFAVMQHLGKAGYREHAAKMWAATERLTAAIDAMPELVRLGRADMNLFAFTTVEGDVFELADRLTLAGWHVQPTYSFGPSPAHVHLTIDPSNAARVDAFLTDLRAAVRELPPPSPPAPEVIAMLAMLGGAEGPSPAMLMQGLGLTDGQLPTRAAPIHHLLEAAPPAVRERLLVLFMGELFT
ncbi:aspartate aminotransferase family protein [Myxococcota bacterium]|nr:aspartate aminotransferase family protein [Myxococcota bacterium]